ncbi:hypothetical protein GCM10010384_19340 [Streptomyces djakartensis]|uniref:Uncharacterized protein n=1 Tax=Streptomyces djakartensis TaxID=68193 RepID=A0ABQ2ZHY0_9ACTN|nr:hypothetical protein GCM10010384_19340 [Streptomyces djakartensis]
MLWAMGDDLGTRYTGLSQGGGERVGMRLQRVVERGRPVADAVPQEIDQQRPPTSQSRIDRDFRDVGG